MAYQSLYRRYRPSRFSEIRGQSHVVTALRNAVRNNSVSHAYLFSGPRGTGKTSTARILAKALNCENLQDGEPCCECGSCVDMEAGRSFDLFELDAASNNGVDAIRDLVDRAAVGSPGRTKVYILDEVHMLSTAASNALLKTLEEPPGHVRFVLATTDPQKVLPTIKSRTQHYEFQLLGASELEDYVRWIIADADLSVDDEAVRWSVRQGKGSARDTLSALDQVVAAGGVVERVEPVDALLVSLAEADPGAAIRAVADALNLGHDPRVLGRALLDSLRDLFLLSLDAPVPHLVPEDVERLGEWAARLGTPMLTRSMDVVGNSLVEMRNAADPRIPLEVALIRLTRADADSLDGLIARIEKLEAALAAGGGAAGGGGTADVDAPVAGRSADAARADGAARTGRPARGPDRGGDRGPDRGGDGPAVPLKSAPVPPTSDRGSPRRESSAGSPPVPPSAPDSVPVPPTPPLSAGSAAASGSMAQAAPDPAPSADGPAVDPGVTDVSSPTDGSVDGGGTVDVEVLNTTLTEKVVPSMKGVAKAIYSQGRFISVDGDTAVYLVENAPTKDRAEKSRGQVEELLGRHLGMSISVRITDSAGSNSAGAGRPGSGRAGPGRGDGRADGLTGSRSSSGVPTGAAASATGREPNDPGGPGSHRPPGAPMSAAVRGDRSSIRPGGSDGHVGSGSNGRTSGSTGPLDGAAPPHDDMVAEDDMYMDVHELEDATDVASTGLERLLEAFPGATVIEQDTEVP